MCWAILSGRWSTITHFEESSPPSTLSWGKRVLSGLRLERRGFTSYETQVFFCWWKWLIIIVRCSIPHPTWVQLYNVKHSDILSTEWWIKVLLQVLQCLWQQALPVDWLDVRWRLAKVVSALAVALSTIAARNTRGGIGQFTSWSVVLLRKVLCNHSS